jgi:hypothetical protein
MCERCEELEEKVRQLTELLGVTDESPPRYGLKPCQWVLFQLIAKRGKASYQFLYEAYCLTRREPIQPDTIKCMVHHMNKKLARHGLRITSIWGWGYKLEHVHEYRGSRPPAAASLGDRPALLA